MAPSFGDPEPNDAVNFDTSTYINRGIPEITGLGSFRDKLIVCFDENIMSVNLGSYADGDATIEMDDIVESYGAVSHKCIVPMGDDILFLDKVGISSVARALITATLSPTRESLLVSRELQAALAKFTALAIVQQLSSPSTIASRRRCCSSCLMRMWWTRTRPSHLRD